MKKLIIILVSVISAIVTVCIVAAIIVGVYIGNKLKDASFNYKEYNSNNANTKNIQIYYNSSSKKAFVGRVIANDDNLYIVIPDTIGDIKINKLGGSHGTGAPTLFYIDYRPNTSFGGYFNCSKEDYESIKDTYKVTEYNVLIKITLPKYLNKISFNDISYFSREYYIYPSTKDAAIFNITCDYSIDETNKYFYTKDGIIYNKKTKGIIE